MPRDLPASSHPSSPSEADTGRLENGRVIFGSGSGNTERADTGSSPILPPDERVGFAVMGLGRLSMGQILPAFMESRTARPVALISGRKEKALTVAREYGIPPSSIFTYDEIHRLADRPDIQAVYVATPNAMHVDQVEALAAAGKHILCEKPMSNTAQEAERMIAACKQAGVKLMIAYRCHFEPFNRAVIKLVRSGELGKPKLVEAVNTQTETDPSHWRLKAPVAGGGALPDIGLYCLNGTRNLLGEEPVELFARMVSPADDPRFASVDETFSFMMRFPSGVIANCATSYGASITRKLSIRLEKGSIELENAFAYQGHRLRISRENEGHSAVTEWHIPPANQFTLEIDHFAQCILKDEAPLTSGEEGLRDQKLMEALYCSAREDRMIRLSET